MPYATFVSFDYENDGHYKRLLEAWHENRNFDFSFDDRSSGEIQSSDIGRVKAALTQKIRNAQYTLVIIGKHANALHKDAAAIGHRNWINFEVAQSAQSSSRLVAVKLDKTFESPEQLMDKKPAWAFEFTEAAILKAFREA